MSIQQWNNNVLLVNSIIDELVQEEGLQGQYSQIKQALQRNVDYYASKRLEYSSFDEINREILSNMNEHIERMKNINVSNQVANMVTPINNVNNNYNSIGSNSPETRYTKEHMIQQRQDDFNQKFKSMQENFNIHAKNSPPKKIDFADKTDEDNVKIDNLIEQELQRRKYDYIATNEEDKKSAEKWIHNATPSLKPNINTNTNTTTTANVSNVTYKHDDNSTTKSQNIKLHIHESISDIEPPKPPSILKKVTFSDLMSGQGTVPNTATKHSEHQESITQMTQTSPMAQSSQPIINIEKEYDTYNYLVVNKYALYEDNSPIWTKPVKMYLNHVSQIFIKVFNKDDNTLISQTRCIVDKHKSDDETRYYRCLEPIKIHKKIKYIIKTFNGGGIEFNTSLKHCLQVGELFVKHMKITQENHTELPIDYNNTIVVKLLDEIDINMNDMNDTKVYINNTIIKNVKPLYIETIKTDNGVTNIFIDNIQNASKCNTLLIDKTNTDIDIERLTNERTTNIEIQLPYVVELITQ